MIISILALLGLIFLIFVCVWLYQEYLRPTLSRSASQPIPESNYNVLFDGVYFGAAIEDGDRQTWMLVFMPGGKVAHCALDEEQEQISAALLTKAFYAQASNPNFKWPQGIVDQYVAFGRRVIMAFKRDGKTLGIAGSIQGDRYLAELRITNGNGDEFKLPVNFKFIRCD